MLMTYLDAEINVAYARNRVAEIRAMSGLPWGSRDAASSSGPLSRLRRRLGTGLVSAGQRIGGLTEHGHLSSPSVAGRLS